MRRAVAPDQAAGAPEVGTRQTERPLPESRGHLADLGWVALLLVAALGSNFFFRGMVVDDSTLAWEWADNFLGRRPIAGANVPEDLPPLYPFLLYVSFRIVGHDLVALHLVPFLAALANPILAYFLFRDLFASRRYGALGGLLFLAWPSGLFFYNQALAEPVTLSIVLATLLAYTRERLWSFLFLAVLSLVSAYDSALLCLGLAADAVLRCRRSRFHARLALLVAAGVLVGGLGMLADRNGLHTGLVPWYRLETQLFQRFGQNDVPFSLDKADLIARYWFAYLLIPAVLVGAGADLWRRRRIWGSLPIALYLCYELALTPTFLPMLGVTLRHLTLVVPCGVLLVVASLEAVASGWSRRGKWTRRLAVAYGAAAVAAILLVQAKHAYYHTGIQISTNPVEIVLQNRELPFYVHSSPRLWREDRYFFSRTLPSRSGGWDEVVLDLDGLVRDVCQARGQPVPDGPVRKVELLILRGELDLGWMRLEDSQTPGRSTEIPLEDWRAVSRGGEIEVVRPGGGSPHLSVRPSEGFLFGVAYPLDRTFAADGT
ncbi:MAG: glycosyltransferase family 39 protein, partial [Planctomycetes bacterium]|nr:glycosyltransferase family 39 protein [Planctomycetota bacterium]